MGIQAGPQGCCTGDGSCSTAGWGEGRAGVPSSWLVFALTAVALNSSAASLFQQGLTSPSVLPSTSLCDVCHQAMRRATCVYHYAMRRVTRAAGQQCLATGCGEVLGHWCVCVCVCVYGHWLMCVSGVHVCIYSCLHVCACEFKACSLDFLLLHLLLHQITGTRACPQRAWDTPRALCGAAPQPPAENFPSKATDTPLQQHPSCT